MPRLALSIVAVLVLSAALSQGASAYDWLRPGTGQNNVYTATTKLPLIAISDTQEPWQSPAQVGSPVQAEGGYGYDGGLQCTTCDSCDSGCDSWCCGGCHGWFAEAELLFLQYGRADGMRVGLAAPGENVDASFLTAPRFSVGYITPGGLGTRIRYFEFDHSMPANEGGISALFVDTYVIDFEFFERFAVNDHWDLEASLGIRFNEFHELMSDDGDIRINQFHGFGALAGAELRRLIGNHGAIFGRARGALLADDKRIFNNEGPVLDVVRSDVPVGMLELAIGYDYTIPLNNGAEAFIRTSAEWQSWYNYSSEFNPANELFSGPSDVGFSGFGVALGIMH